MGVVEVTGCSSGGAAISLRLACGRFVIVCRYFIALGCRWFGLSSTAAISLRLFVEAAVPLAWFVILSAISSS